MCREDGRNEEEGQLDASLFVSLLETDQLTFTDEIVFPETSDPGEPKMTIAASVASNYEVGQRLAKRNRGRKVESEGRSGLTIVFP